MFTDHTQTLEENISLNETEPKKRKSLAQSKEWDRNKSKTFCMKGYAFLGYRRENPKNSKKNTPRRNARIEKDGSHV